MPKVNGQFLEKIYNEYKARMNAIGEYVVNDVTVESGEPDSHACSMCRLPFWEIALSRDTLSAMPPRSRSPSTTSDSTNDDIELATLDEVVVTPNPKLLNGQKYTYDEESHSDDGQHADEEALLSPGSGNSSRWRDSKQRKDSGGKLILGLVLEVRLVYSDLDEYG